MKEKNFYKVIHLPHLRFTLYIPDMSKLKGVDMKGGAGYTTLIEDGDESNIKACIFFDHVKEMVKIPKNFSIIAHEVMHIIQILCSEYCMSLEEEKEHTAYIMSYILDEILK